MSDETLTVRTRIDVTPGVVFDVLADPTTHEAIDGTGWVRASDDGEPIREAGQLFGMGMYHENHPDGHYTVCNRVEEFDPPRTVSWKPGWDPDGSGQTQFGGWIWRYDLTPVGSSTEVTLTYDWTAVPAALREYIEFPPFGVDHLENSLANLAGLAAPRACVPGSEHGNARTRRQPNVPARGSSAGTR